MKTKLLIILLACIKIMDAQTWVTIPDANFATYLQSVIPYAMSGNQLNTSSTLVTGMDSIVVNSKNISNLSGIQYFTSLTYLDCDANNLISLPALPSSLVHLSCDADHLTSIPALPNTLQILYCENNSLTSLPSLPNTLVYLVCELNHLTSLPPLPNSLTWLVCNNNNITCFPTFPNSIGSLQIGGNPYNCLPNYIPVMDSADLAKPLCAAGNTNGCAVATGIEQFANNNVEVTVYPNPNNGVFNLTMSQFDNLKTNHIEVYNINGECVHRQITTSANCQINLSNLAEGVYNLSIISNNGVVNKRLVIVR